MQLLNSHTCTAMHGTSGSSSCFWYEYVVICVYRDVICGLVEADRHRPEAKRPMAARIDCRPVRRSSQAEGLKNGPDRLKA